MLASSPNNPVANVEIQEAQDVASQANEAAGHMFSSDSLKLKSLGMKCDIKNTRSLVDAFNNSEPGSQERMLLRKWLQSYNDLFSSKRDKLMDSEIDSYSYLAGMKCSNRYESEVVMKFFSNLCISAFQNDSSSKIYLAALERALDEMQLKLLKNCQTKLLSIVDHLFTKIEQMSYSRLFFSENSIVLFTLQRTFQKFLQLSQKALTRTKIDEYLGKLDEIERKSEYFPYVFQAKLLRLDIKSFEANDCYASLVRMGRCFLHLLLSGMHVMQGLREIANIKPDITAFEAGWQHLKQARSLMEDCKEFVELSKLLKATKETLEDNNLDHFKKCYEKLKPDKAFRGLKLPNKIINFALVFQLRMLVTNGSTIIQSYAIGELVRLGKLPKEDQWVQDPDIFEALLDALNAITRSSQNEDCQAASAIEFLKTTQNEKLRKKFEDWEQMDKDEEDLLEKESDTADPLFQDSRKSMQLLLNFDGLQTNLNELKERYQRDEFSKVSLTTSAFVHFVLKVHALLQDDHLKDVREFEYDIVCFDDKGRQQQPSSFNYEGEMHRRKRHNEHQQRSHISVNLESLFDARAINAQNELNEVKRLLLFGNPGTGKTSLSKTYAVKWASSLLGKEFQYIFVLPFRELTDRILDDKSERTKMNLETAIARICFRHRKDDDYKALCDQIVDCLCRKTTLLIMDGLDEADMTGQHLLEQAFDAECKLLLTSRRYNMKRVQKNEHIELEMECVGMDDEQLTKFFIRESLSQDDAQSLMKKLKSNPDLWELAHVPILAVIMCTVWTRRKEENGDDVTGKNVYELFRKMRLFLWNRYVEKGTSPMGADREIVFEALQKIAFHAQMKQKILVEKITILEYATTSELKSILTDSGFLLLINEGESYQFPHLLFQEQFCGYHLSQHFLISKEPQKEVMDFISANKYKPIHRVTLSFMMHHRVHGDVADLEKVFKLIDLQPFDFIGEQHILLKLSLFENFLSIYENDCGMILRSPQCMDLMVSVVILSLVWVTEIDRIDNVLAAFQKIPNVIEKFPQLISPILFLLENFQLQFNDEKVVHLTLEKMRESVKNFISEYSNISAIRYGEASVSQRALKEQNLMKKTSFIKFVERQFYGNVTALEMLTKLFSSIAHGLQTPRILEVCTKLADLGKNANSDVKKVVKEAIAEIEKMKSDQEGDNTFSEILTKLETGSLADVPLNAIDALPTVSSDHAAVASTSNARLQSWNFELQNMSGTSVSREGLSLDVASDQTKPLELRMFENQIAKIETGYSHLMLIG